MIRFKNYAITLDGEYPVVNKVTVAKSGQKEGEEILAALYYPRDMLGALLILQRITTTDASRDCKTLEEAIEAINKNHEELSALVEGLSI